MPYLVHSRNRKKNTTNCELPTNNSFGFTLIELLVVITIIAILSVIGLTVFTGLQGKARDAKRKLDIDSIAKALEVNFDIANQYYGPLKDNHFSDNIPFDSADKDYCMQTESLRTNPTPSVPAANIWIDRCPSGWTKVSTSFPSGSFAKWRVCAMLEEKDSQGERVVFCKTNSQ